MERTDQENSTLHQPLIPSNCPLNANHQIRLPIPSFRSPWSPSRSRTEAMGVSRLENIRCSTIVLGISNAAIALLGGFLIVVVYPSCERQYVLPFLVVSLVSCIRIVTMVQSGIAQEATARTILESPGDAAAVVDTVMRRERRTLQRKLPTIISCAQFAPCVCRIMKTVSIFSLIVNTLWKYGLVYKRWLWWTRFALILVLLQFAGAVYLIFHMTNYIAHDETSSGCALGVASNDRWWKRKLLVLFTTLVCFVALVQCFTGMDVLRWRSFYSTQDHAWKAHYSEIFDHGIREALCCLGRSKYLSITEEDEVFSVAQLLGDLVAYRSTGTGHLEFLAGLALLQRHGQVVHTSEELMEAPIDKIEEAAVLHKFAEAAYTGPLLDFGRNPLSFPCAWAYRQGILTPWTRNKRPVLHGDNWWRGHAAAFLKYVNLPPEVLRRGRVNQAKCEAAYFVLVLHDVKCVVIAVRGTETPEDLITDGLCRECALSEEDLDGLINCDHIQPSVKQRIISSFPHHAHSGIVEAARDLYMQIEGDCDGAGSEPCGLLSSLLGPGCECDGYQVRIVGHSLGGAIAALLGLRLYGRCPSLQVYAYGPLPCVDSIIANACSEFVTRLSVGSIMRLRSAAIKTLSQDSKDKSTPIFQLARRFLYLSNYQRDGTERTNSQSEKYPTQIEADDQGISTSFQQNETRADKKECQESSLLAENQIKANDITVEGDEFSNSSDLVSQIIEAVEGSENKNSTEDFSEMYLPGLLIHIVPEERRFTLPFLNSLRCPAVTDDYKAYVASRENFKEIIVSPSMLLDHLPWRCHAALQRLVDAQTAKDPASTNLHMLATSTHTLERRLRENNRVRQQERRASFAILCACKGFVSIVSLLLSLTKDQKVPF
ncbi:diacylglycerol lipase-beta isoform X3 [Benincasa hispida]|uniref:diacylglycerol lipase-beta isoform X3 n=1 Tax=Benincasa hispida TaxID=102211 RepID=UPI00190205A1|nr:diacylglycerol lipase-beta isoform X3 [Benincasa hispida]